MDTSEKDSSVLAPFEFELTQKVASSDALASAVIPAVTTSETIYQGTDEDHGIKTIKETGAAAVQEHFADTEEKSLYCSAM